MRMYCYADRNGRVRWTREKPELGIRRVGFKPIISAALAVHPSQITQEQARLKHCTGMDVAFTKWGQPVLDSEEKRFRVAKACNCHNLDGNKSH
mgnify:CR=1 FL=1